MRSRIRTAGALLALWAALLASPAAVAVPPDTLVGSTRLSYSVVVPPQHFPEQPQLAALGKQVFFDSSLSEPRGLSCSGCHDPKQAFSGDRGTGRGVASGSHAGRFGLRNTPSLLYVRYVPALYLYQDDDSPVSAPIGGLFADGRVDDLVQLPLAPLTNPLEMNNHGNAQVAKKLARARYASEFRKIFGDKLFSDPKQAVEAMGRAVQAYLQSDEMAPFSSRYDAFTRGQGTLTAQELRGLTLFRNPGKGNCASCHLFNETSRDPTRSLFTDFGYDALAVPRNPAIPANRDPRYFDLGLCKTVEHRGWTDHASWCGYFRTPTLRNAAVRKAYMHNGAFKKLRDVVAFYATRSTDPDKWYPKGQMFNDVPAAYRGNVNIQSTPYNRRVGMKPTLNDAEIDDIVAFLVTLTDQPYQALLQPLAASAGTKP